MLCVRRSDFTAHNFLEVKTDFPEDKCNNHLEEEGNPHEEHSKRANQAQLPAVCAFVFCVVQEKEPDKVIDPREYNDDRKSAEVEETH